LPTYDSNLGRAKGFQPDDWKQQHHLYFIGQPQNLPLPIMHQAKA
jgi:hypothetical protein